MSLQYCSSLCIALYCKPDVSGDDCNKDVSTNQRTNRCVHQVPRFLGKHYLCSIPILSWMACVGIAERKGVLWETHLVGAVGVAAVGVLGVEHLLVAQFTRRLDCLGHGTRRRLHVEHVAHVVILGRLHDEGTVSEACAFFMSGRLPCCPKRVPEMKKFLKV